MNVRLNYAVNRFASAILSDGADLMTFMTEVKPSCPKADQAALVFNPAKHYLWPIPQKEIDVNPNIEQEDQNPGY